MSSTRKRVHLRNPKFHSSLSHSHLKYFLEPPSDFFPSRDEVLRAVTFLVIAISVAVSCKFFVYLFTPHSKPFCGSDEIIDGSLLSDFCDPCPPNGKCYEGVLECVNGYRKQGNQCIEDGKINEEAKRLSEWVESGVCEDYAQYLCSGIGTIWVHEDKIWNTLNQSKLLVNLGFDSTEYTRQRAFETVSKSLEKRTNSLGVKEFKCPDPVAEHYKPFECRIQQWFLANALHLIPACALLVGCSLLVLKIRRRHHLSTRAEELYHQVCDILEENALTLSSVGSETEPWVVASWLRDHLLLPRDRKNPLLWKKVEELVQEDSRLDMYPKVVKGESKVVWEWQVRGSLSSARMRKMQGKRKHGSSYVPLKMDFDRESPDVKSTC